MGPMPKTITRLGLSRRWFIAAGGTTLLGARRRLASAQGRNFEVKWVGASRDVVRGDLTPRISLESLMPMNRLYAVGPPEGLRGEITIIDSQPYVSRIEDGHIVVDHSSGTGRCFSSGPTSESGSRYRSRARSVPFATSRSSWRQLEGTLDSTPPGLSRSCFGQR